MVKNYSFYIGVSSTLSGLWFGSDIFTPKFFEGYSYSTLRVSLTALSIIYFTTRKSRLIIRYSPALVDNLFREGL